MYEHIDELLFTSRDLAQGEHSVTVTNEVQYGTPDPSKICEWANLLCLGITDD